MTTINYDKYDTKNKTLDILIRLVKSEFCRLDTIKKRTTVVLLRYMLQVDCSSEVE